MKAQPPTALALRQKVVLSEPSRTPLNVTASPSHQHLFLFSLWQNTLNEYLTLNLYTRVVSIQGYQLHKGC